MKKILMLVCCTICIVLIYSCHKDSKVIPADYYFKVNKNGADWGAQGSTYTIPGDSLKLTALSPVGGEQIYVNIKFNGTGTYPLTGKQAAFFISTGMDVITSNYRLDTTQTSSLVVLSYNTKTRIISGTFELHVLLDSSDPNVYVPISFTNGIFRVKLPD
jgi:hypothetical protein